MFMAFLHLVGDLIVYGTLGILAPRSWYCLGFFRKLTNSMISSLASSQPATSLNFTSISSFRIFAVVSLTLNNPPIPRPGRPAPAGPRRTMNSKNPMMSTVGSMLSRKVLERTDKRYTQYNRYSYLHEPVYHVAAHPSLSVEYTTGSLFSPSMPSSYCAVSRFLSNVSTLPMLNHTYCNTPHTNKQTQSPAALFKNCLLCIESSV